MASSVDIANAALQKLGAPRIVNLTDDSDAARAANACYNRLRQAELRKHVWNFSIRRANIAADATAPISGSQYANSFTFPPGTLRILKPDPKLRRNDWDWQIEGTSILTNDSAPLLVRYVYDETDPNKMDSLFREALAARMALEMCEELTQSNSKKEAANAWYDSALADAKRANAVEQIPQEFEDDTWVTVRA